MYEIYQSYKKNNIYNLHTLWRMHLILSEIISREEDRFREDQQKMLVSTL